MLSGDEEKGTYNGAKKLLDSGVDADLRLPAGELNFKYRRKRRVPSYRYVLKV